MFLAPHRGDGSSACSFVCTHLSRLCYWPMCVPTALLRPGATSPCRVVRGAVTLAPEGPVALIPPCQPGQLFTLCRCSCGQRCLSPGTEGGLTFSWGVFGLQTSSGCSEERPGWPARGSSCSKTTQQRKNLTHWWAWPGQMVSHRGHMVTGRRWGLGCGPCNRSQAFFLQTYHMQKFR